MFGCVSICLLSGLAVSVVLICDPCHNTAADTDNAATVDNAYLGTPGYMQQAGCRGLCAECVQS